MQQSPSSGKQFPPAERAARLLARLGFELVHGKRNEAPGGALLLVALRDPPTFDHFDPERIDYWVTAEGRGQRASLDRRTEEPFEADFAWGTITVVDRLEVSNSFLTFGGRIRLRTIDSGFSLAVVASPAPILRWLGHSQGIDPLGTEVGGAFARLKVPIDFIPGAEAAIAEAGPLALYAAVIGDLRARFARIPSLQDLQPVLARQTWHEMHWLQESAPEDWKAGQRLRRELGLVPGAAPHPSIPPPVA